MALAVLIGLPVALSQGSAPHHGAQGVAGKTRPTEPVSSAPTTPAPSPRRAPRPRPARRSTQPVIVPVAQTSSAPAPQPATSPASPPARFAALAGPGCPAGASFGTSSTVGWYTQSSGGWTGNGCSGRYFNKWAHEAGTAPLRTFTWWFSTGIPGSATCRVSVHIPAGSSTAVGANPASYTVFTGPGSKVAGTFGLDQRDNHGTWLYAGAFPADSGQFSVQVNNIGGGSDEVAADAVKVSCAA